MSFIETERLNLSKLRLADADFVLRLLNEPAFHKYIGDKGVRSIEDAKDYIRKDALANYEQYGYGMYLAKLKDSDSPIGLCGLKQRDSLEIPDLGYALSEKYWSSGYATEAARGVIDHSRSELGLSRLAALTSLDNDASIRVLEKVGFSFRKIIKLPEFKSDSKLFVLDL